MSKDMWSCLKTCVAGEFDKLSLSSALPKVSTRWRKLCLLQQEGGRGIKEGGGGGIKEGGGGIKGRRRELKKE